MKEETKESKWEEEAIEEEIWQAIMNLACAEEHLLESAMRGIYEYLKTKDKEVKTKVEELLIECNIIRDYRKRLLNKILSIRKVNLKNEEGNFRTLTGEEWCKIKHYLIIKMHLFETAQKYLTLFSKTEERKYLDEAIDCINMAKDIHQLFLLTVEDIFPRGD